MTTMATLKKATNNSNTSNKLSASCSLVLQQIRFLDVPLPRFEPSEIKTGRTLGEGRYCTVQEIESFPLPLTTVTPPPPSLTPSPSSSSLLSSSSSSSSHQRRRRSSSVPRNLGRGSTGNVVNQPAKTQDALEQAKNDKLAAVAALLGGPPPPPPPSAASSSPPPTRSSPSRTQPGRIQRRHSCHASMGGSGSGSGSGIARTATHQQEADSQRQAEDPNLSKLLQKLEEAKQQSVAKQATQHRCRQQLAAASRRRKSTAEMSDAKLAALLQTIDEEEDDDHSDDCGDDDDATVISASDEFSLTSTLDGSPHNSSKCLSVTVDMTPTTSNSSSSTSSDDDEEEEDEANQGKNCNDKHEKRQNEALALKPPRGAMAKASSLSSLCSLSTAARSGGSGTCDGESSGTSFSSRPRAARRSSTGMTTCLDVSDMMDKVQMRTQPCLADGTCRYVLKRVRKDFFGDADHDTAASSSRIVAARTSLAMEAHLLTKLAAHPNIVRLRGVLPDFSLVLDRVETTLDCRMEEWAAQEARLSTMTMPCNNTNNNDGKRNLLRRHSGGSAFAKVVAATVKGGNSGRASADERMNRERQRHDLWTRRLMLCYDVALVMKYLESQGVILRDLRLENVGLDRQDTVKLFDFGGAKEVSNPYCQDQRPKKATMMQQQQPSCRHLKGHVAGVLPYMAPELYQGRSYGPRVDSYSFGILLWEVLALRRLVPDDQGSESRGRSRGRALRTSKKGDHAPLRPNWKLCKTWPESIRVDLLPQCCSLDPTERPHFTEICQLLMTEVASSLMTQVEESNCRQEPQYENSHKALPRQPAPPRAALTQMSTVTAINRRRTRSLTSLLDKPNKASSLIDTPSRPTWHYEEPTILLREENVVTRIAV